MNRKILAMAAVSLLVYLPGVQAVEIESTTTQYLTFRECVAGESPCDQVKPESAHEVDGLPGSPGAQASRDEPGFGSASGSTQLSDTGIGSEHHARASSLKGTRVGSNGFMLQKYTNNSDETQSLTFSGTLVFEQTVPEGNASIAEGSPGQSGANAELGAYRYGAEVVEAGTTAEDNFRLLLEGPQGEAELDDLGWEKSDTLYNQGGEGSQVISVTVTAAPGESTWFWAGLQALSSNGAEVSGKLTTELHVNAEN